MAKRDDAFRKGKNKHDALQHRYERTTEVPAGLTFGRVVDLAGCQAALAEAEAIFADPTAAGVASQIASNRHFFVNLPFPLVHEVAREDTTPTLSWEDERIVSLTRLVRALVQNDDRLLRANVIVREYLPRQKISFHVDDLKCENEIYGLVLLNEDPTGKGLSLTKGGGARGKELCFTIREMQGATFCLSDQARYAWKHGIFPVSHRRISVTVRILKAQYVEDYNTGIGVETVHRERLTAKREAATTAASPAAPPKQVLVSLCDNRKPHCEKPVLVPSLVGLVQFRTIAKNKLHIQPKMQPRFYLDGDNGQQLYEGQLLPHPVPPARHKIYVVVRGEAFRGKVQIAPDDAKMQEKATETDAILCHTAIKQQFEI